MKREWKKPELEVLEVTDTMASTVNGPYTDEAYVPGVPVEDQRPDIHRFTS
ncbi:paeninodin family lasso peptide [Alkalihalobacterium alkalinitrilicum]|uniref:paeninodin family lasso peptide n=1 Tax=Alkalihalobacterium alkalinitrilicum TaxID=427920 RepID=UPI00114D74F4|nr:paeninodin family lasso peptide [Alkalihalobacterium alkalinitrilicum]